MQRRGGPEVTGLRSRRPPFFYEATFSRELHHAVVGPFPVHDEDLAVWGDSDAARPIERVRTLPCNTSGAERHEHFAVRTELHDDSAHSVRDNTDIGDPHVALVVHTEAVRSAKHSDAETRQELA